MPLRKTLPATTIKPPLPESARRPRMAMAGMKKPGPHFRVTATACGLKGLLPVLHLLAARAAVLLIDLKEKVVGFLSGQLRTKLQRVLCV